MARRMRALDWSRNPLGNPQDWPQNLKTSVRIMLTARQPMFVWWGEELINLYNDGYGAFLSNCLSRRRRDSDADLTGLADFVGPGFQPAAGFQPGV
jgi:hypothetical protein